LWFLVLLVFVFGIFIGYSVAVGVQNLDSVIKGESSVVVVNFSNNDSTVLNSSCFESCLRGEGFNG
jgi:hypothetical protein